MVSKDSALLDLIHRVYTMDDALEKQYDVKRGLRNADGTGVLAGLTKISNVHGYVMSDGDRVPSEGRLVLRGYDIRTLIDNAIAENRFGYEEVAFLLVLGKLPTRQELDNFNSLIDEMRDLPDGFVNSLILKAPSADTMNMMARSILNLYAYDDNPEEIDLVHELDTSIALLSRLPRIAALSYNTRHALDTGEKVVWHPARAGDSMAETVLYMLREDMTWTEEEARLLDIMLVLHAEHGGGNNSTFTCRVLTSAGTDPYSAYSGAICSLKGPKHGGANARITAMTDDLMASVPNWTDEGSVADYLRRILNKEAFDRSGLIYGMGHAVYTLSDPRAEIVKGFARDLAVKKGYSDRMELLETIERLTPVLMEEKRGVRPVISANIDLYTGLIYEMLGIPREMLTPLFAMSRLAGWTAHRLEELLVSNRIIRPAYKSVFGAERTYVPIDER